LRRLSSREARRLMQRMGMEVEPLEGAREVIIRLEGRSLVIRDPHVSVVKMAGQSIYQVLGEAVEVKELEEVSISEEDVQLVASQAGVSLDRARRALEETGGDLARAILMLKTES